MEILLTASTFFEIQALVGQMELVKNMGPNYARFRFQNQELDVLISGLGAGIASYQIARSLSSKSYDRVLSVGFACALTDKLEPGSIVNVIDDQFGDLGYWGTDGFQTLFDAGAIQPDEFPFHGGIMENNERFSPIVDVLPKVTGITLNSLPSATTPREPLFAKLGTDVMSMDGAASFYCCMNDKVPCVQIRMLAPTHSDLIQPNRMDPNFIQSFSDSLQKILKEWLSKREL